MEGGLHKPKIFMKNHGFAKFEGSPIAQNIDLNSIILNTGSINGG